MRDARSTFASFIERFLAAKQLSVKSRIDYARYLHDFDVFTGETSLEAALTYDNATKVDNGPCMSARASSTTCGRAAALGFRTVFIDRHGETLETSPTRVLRDLSKLPDVIDELAAG